jgi:hypothetical protein
MISLGEDPDGPRTTGRPHETAADFPGHLETCFPGASDLSAEVVMATSSEGGARQQATPLPERLDESVPSEALVRVSNGYFGQLDVEAAASLAPGPPESGSPASPNFPPEVGGSGL